jgi:hypothetical protein
MVIVHPSKLHDYPTAAADGLRFYISSKSTVTVGAYDAEYQMCQVLFQKRDGSIFVSFPYAPATPGILSVISMPRRSEPVTISLTERGKVTSHLVKFAHHPDGRVHFSQAGRIRTKVLSQSFPLEGSGGRVFQLNVYWPSAFKVFDFKARKLDRVYLQHKFAQRLPSSIIIKAEWRPRSEIIRGHPGNDIGPLVTVWDTAADVKFKAFLLGQPANYPLNDHLLIVSAHHGLDLSDITEPTMLFMSGEARTKPASEKAELIAFMYPIENYSTLIHQLGSVDLPSADSIIG